VTNEQHDPAQADLPLTSPVSKLPSPPQAAVLATPAQPQPRALRHYSGLELWLHRITVLMFVFVCAAVGVLLVILPWRPEWTDNYLLLNYPDLRMLISNAFVRGMCSGLGLLDIWIGFWEAIHYREAS
jgi:hypothetical protein